MQRTLRMSTLVLLVIALVATTSSTREDLGRALGSIGLCIVGPVEVYACSREDWLAW